MKTQTRIAILLGLLVMASSARSQPYVAGPTNVAGAWVTTIVPDMLLWYNTNGYYTNGPITNLSAEAVNLGNWEPYIDQMGDTTFLIGANTFADDGSLTNQQYEVALQPAAGGNPVEAYEFNADNGSPFSLEIDLSRENGNPGRIAGDHRPGATNYISMDETSAGQLQPFESNSRWTSNSAMYTGVNRYCTEQVYSLNPATLAYKPASDAWDFVYGPMTATNLNLGNNAPQLSRTGGRPVFLDNGNIAVVIDDKTCFLSSAGEVTTFSIITPTGSIVAGPTLVSPAAIWDNVAAFSGGFAVRVGSYLAFYDDSGNLIATNGDVNASSGLSFDSGRGDNTRIGSDIHSHYVYLAGETPDTGAANPVSLAVFDARTGDCVATNMVSDTDPTMHAIDRVVVAVNANDQFCVAYDMSPDQAFFPNYQIAVRLGRFDGTNITFSTPSFFPFISSDTDPFNVLGYLTENPSVTMTTNYVCVAGKGTVNSTNNPAGGPDTALQTTLYTVFKIPQYVQAPLTVAQSGLTNVVPDTLVWFNTNGFYTNGPITNPSVEAVNLGNWEPYIDQMGDSTFLIGANTFADDGTLTNQQYEVTLQPVGGGSPVNAYEFYADNGSPFSLEIDLSRENGNPGRIAGDHRPGATNYISMDETSAGQLQPFESNQRWTSNSAMYTGVNRYCTEQVYTFNPITLNSEPLVDAWDFVYGPMQATTLPANNGAPQLSRTGGRPVFLDNGNIAVVIDDKTCFLSTAGEVTTFSIITPTGAIVAGPTLVSPNAIWDNVAAFNGGFAVRVGSYLAFYDDSGNLIATNANVNTSSGLSFDSGRGDNTRIASDIHSHYVYLAGETPDSSPGNPVSLAIFDSRTGNCVATNIVSDIDPAYATVDRTSVAVDAADHFCVVYDMVPNTLIWTNDQIVARIGAFDGTNVTYATSSFFPFLNSDVNATNVLGMLTENPTVAMTPDYICIAGKGTVNGTNSAAAGPTTAAQTTLYTVINNPYAASTIPVLSISPVSNDSVVVSWTGSPAAFGNQRGGTLQETTALGDNAVWLSLTNNSPATIKISGAQMFFRVISGAP